MPTKPVEFHDEASVEYDAAFDWYLMRSSLGLRCRSDRALGDIASAPQRWAMGQYSTRRYLLREFPYILVYRERADDIQVVAVAHTSRRPGYWKKRLRK